MAKKTPEVWYKAKWDDGDIYALEGFKNQKSVRGVGLVVSLGSDLVSLESALKRLGTTKTAYEQQKSVVKALKEAKPKLTRKGRK